LLGALIVVSGLGYATDSFGTVLSQGSWTDITSFTFIGEFLLALWLLIPARHIARSASGLTMTADSRNQVLPELLARPGREGPGTVGAFSREAPG
jgi:hypothetical protein